MALITDLGELSGPALVFGGPYSNLQATRAVKAVAEDLRIPAGRAICTGDLVAYGADPRATVDLVRAWGNVVVMGNCEESLAQDADACGCNFIEGSECDLLSRQWYAYAAARMDPSSRAWMGNLPCMVKFTMSGRRVAVIHGGIDEINHFIFSTTDAEEKRRQVRAANVDVIVAGHSGIPFTQDLGDGLVWHNAGALGMPANDGTADVWYSILSPATQGIDFAHHRLAYDHKAAATRMRDAGLPEAYARALEIGIWPNQDILPEAERQLAGGA